MKQRIILSLFLLNFTLVFAQLEEIRNVDRIYDAKAEEIKNLNKRPKKYHPLLSELNTERIAEYNKILAVYYEKDSVVEGSVSSYEEIQKSFETIDKIKRMEKGEKVEGITRTVSQMPPIAGKPIEYKNGGIGGFRQEFAKLFNIDNLPNYYKSANTQIKTVLTFIIDTDGNIRKVNAKGDNEHLNTMAKVALYKTAGNWIPAERDGKKKNDVFRFPVVLQ